MPPQLLRTWTSCSTSRPSRPASTMGLIVLSTRHWPARITSVHRVSDHTIRMDQTLLIPIKSKSPLHPHVVSRPIILSSRRIIAPLRALLSGSPLFYTPHRTFLVLAPSLSGKASTSSVTSSTSVRICTVEKSSRGRLLT